MKRVGLAEAGISDGFRLMRSVDGTAAGHFQGLVGVVQSFGWDGSNLMCMLELIVEWT
jgi:hypothetical protein